MPGLKQIRAARYFTESALSDELLREKKDIEQGASHRKEGLLKRDIRLELEGIRLLDPLLLSQVASQKICLIVLDDRLGGFGQMVFGD